MTPPPKKKRNVCLGGGMCVSECVHAHIKISAFVCWEGGVEKECVLTKTALNILHLVE